MSLVNKRNSNELPYEKLVAFEKHCSSHNIIMREPYIVCFSRAASWVSARTKRFHLVSVCGPTVGFDSSRVASPYCCIVRLGFVEFIVTNIYIYVYIPWILFSLSPINVAFRSIYGSQFILISSTPKSSEFVTSKYSTRLVYMLIDGLLIGD